MTLLASRAARSLAILLLALLVGLLGTSCGSTPSRPTEVPVRAPQSEGPRSTWMEGPSDPAECDALHPEQAGRCHWSIEVTGSYTPCCGDWTGGPVCVCHGCRGDADCSASQGARCRSFRGAGGSPQARVCVAPGEPCGSDPPACGDEPGPYGRGHSCAHDGAGRVTCVPNEPDPA